VAFPTETVYGLGAHALDEAAVRRIFLAKGRPGRNPVIVHVSDIDQARSLVAGWPTTAEQLARRFWPGPLTLVLPRLSIVPDIVTGGGPTVGLRIPAHPVALALLRRAALPVAAPSANSANYLSPTRAEHVLADLGDKVDVILDGGACPGGLESTVVDLSGAQPRLLRPGLVSREQVEAVIGPLAEAGFKSISEHGALPAPGMLPRHYAPRTPTWLWETESEAFSAAAAAQSQGRRAGVLRFRQAKPESLPSDLQGGARLAHLALPPDPIEAARQLYDGLHNLDRAGLDELHIALPPDQPQWLAIRDRLLRAGGQGKK
jgi:L-threonylcarbamoyladenylate synthase